MRLGISSYTYVWAIGVPGYARPARPLTAFDLLDKAAGLGVRVLQIADNLPLVNASDVELAMLAGQAASRRIDLEVGTSGLERDSLLAWLGLATRLGSPILRVVIDTEQHQPTPGEAVTLLRDVVPEFERSDVILAIENHDRFASGVLLDILTQTASDHVGICFDTANSIGCLESAERVLSVLGPHVVNVHIKDYCLFRPPHNKGFVVEGRPAGQGQLDIPRLLEQLRSQGRDPNVIVELWPPPQSTLEQSIALEDAWATESVTFMRKHLTE